MGREIRYCDRCAQLVSPGDLQSGKGIATDDLLQHRVDFLLENAQGSRHPHGGGWVARSATVAPTAYVGPECMVLDGARVLDRAIIEDYAIVSGKDVVVRDNAKVYGKAIVCGAVELSGYARVSRNIINRACTIETIDDPERPYHLQVSPSGAFTRTGPEQRRLLFKGFDLGLQANYEFDQRETVLMEDHYQEHGNDDAYLHEMVFYNGVLHGRPGFVTDGDIRAVTFNGIDQYAEAAANVADLGEITVDVAFRWDRGGTQTLFDFGTSEDNCFTLVLSSSGRPELRVRTDGRSQAARSRRAISRGEWTRCRVEIDGAAIRLWLDDQKVAETTSSFRAADVYPGGVEKRNFIAAARGAKDLYRGAIDYFRIYHVVHEDFAGAPEVPLVSSRRINPDYPRRFSERYADYDVKKAKADAQCNDDELYKFYQKFYGDMKRRRAELEQSDEVDRLKEQLAELKATRDRRRGELNDEYQSRPEIQAMRARHAELRKQYEPRRRKVRELYEDELAELGKRTGSPGSNATTTTTRYSSIPRT